MQPGKVEEAARTQMARTFPEWDTDKLSERVEILHARLHGKDVDRTIAQIVFFHCSCGCDRTGEMAAAYSMRYLNRTFTEMYRENERIAGRHIVYKNQVAAQWYCEHLRARGLHTGDDCGNCEPFRCADDGSPVLTQLKMELGILGVKMLILVFAVRAFSAV
jgi:hypothetical protein